MILVSIIHTALKFGTVHELVLEVLGLVCNDFLSVAEEILTNRPIEINSEKF